MSDVPKEYTFVARVHLFSKCGGNLKIADIRSLKCNKYRPDSPQVLGATVQSLVFVKFIPFWYIILRTDSRTAVNLNTIY